MEFVSTKKRNLRVVIVPRIAREIGGVRIMQGMNQEDFPNGLTIEFQDGTYQTEDKKIIDAIKKHPHYGSDFVSTDKEETVAPSDQSLRENNEKAEIAEALASKCPECGKEFGNTNSLNGHMKVHSDKV